MFEQRLADPLHHAPMHLAQCQARIKQAAVVVEDHVAVERHFTRRRIDLHFGDMAPVGERVAVAEMRRLVRQTGRNIAGHLV